MPKKQVILERLEHAELKGAARRLDVSVRDQRRRQVLIEALSASEVTTRDIVALLPKERLRQLCQALGIEDRGRRKAELLSVLTELSPPTAGAGKPAAHSAAPTLAGFQWQLRQALLMLFRLDFGEAVEIEVHDDVSVVNLEGDLLTAVQAKHDLTGKTLTEKTTDWWKTLRAWISLVEQEELQQNTALVLVTPKSLSRKLAFLGSRTATATESDERALDGLRKLLDGIAKAGTNTKLKPYYIAWSSMSQAKKLALLKRIRIDAYAKRLADVHKQINKALRHAFLQEEKLVNYADEVVGWFTRIVDERLTTTGCRVTYEELHEYLMTLHERRYPSPPPQEPTETPIPELADERSEDPTYLRQMDLLEATDEELYDAVRKYHRARSARDEWINDTLIAREQLGHFDQDLQDQWKNVHRSKSRPLAKKRKGDESLVDAGWQIHDKCMEYRAPVGNYQAQTYLANGTYHILADEPRVGWHPRFRELLEDEDV